MKTENTLGDIEKLKALQKAIENCNGVLIPYNIIKHNMVPLSNWLDKILSSDQ